MSNKFRPMLLVALLLGVALAGCASQNGDGGSPNPNDGTPTTGGDSGGDGPTNDWPSGRVTQVGSSTVLPIAEAWAEEIAQASGSALQVTVAGGGSGRGASAICAGEADIGDMSRTLKESEIADCRANGIEPQVWKVAFDGLTVVINVENSFVDHLTVAELEHIWRGENPAQTWADVRAGWPDAEIVRYGPDSDSGTFEYFNEVILGDDCGASGDDQCPITADYQPSADDNVIVEGVARSQYAIGHFGFAYYLENEGVLKAVAIQDGAGAPAVEPSFATIADGSYSPLSRPIFMVTDGKPAEGTPLHAYFDYAMNEGQDLIRAVGYVELDDTTLSEQRGWL